MPLGGRRTIKEKGRGGRGVGRAETSADADYGAAGGEAGAKDAGKLRVEGKDYVTKDGDIFHFRFNV